MNRCIVSCLLYCLMGCVVPLESAHQVTVQLQNQQQSKMKLMLGTLSLPEEFTAFVATVCNDLSCFNQKKSGFDCKVQEFSSIPSKSMLQQLGKDGYPMIVFLSMKENNLLEWRVYDTFQAAMYCGKRMELNQENLSQRAHLLSDSLWELLTGQSGIFSTKIAYCCEKNERSHKGTDLYIKTPFGADARRLVKGGKLLAPRWNKNKKNPLILYSEMTPSNVRLVSTTLHGKKRIVSNFDGLTMLPSFSSDGYSVVYCATYEGTSQLYRCSLDKKSKRQKTERITHNKGNNTSPNVCDNGDIIFCSDFETKTPQLYYLHIQDGRLERLTSSGYCASPNFCEKNGKIAFHKLCGNTMQVVLYDLATKQETLLTTSPGNKDECSWSPCGNYLAYSVERGASSRIALYNLITHEEITITDTNQRCLYPSWS